jgi:YfhE-like protein
MTEKRRREKIKSTLTSAQEVSYARDFKLADQAGGYTAKKAKH